MLQILLYCDICLISSYELLENEWILWCNSGSGDGEESSKWTELRAHHPYHKELSQVIAMPYILHI